MRRSGIRDDFQRRSLAVIVKQDIDLLRWRHGVGEDRRSTHRHPPSQRGPGPCIPRRLKRYQIKSTPVPEWFLSASYDIRDAVVVGRSPRRLVPAGSARRVLMRTLLYLPVTLRSEPRPAPRKNL